MYAGGREGFGLSHRQMLGCTEHLGASAGRAGRAELRGESKPPDWACPFEGPPKVVACFLTAGLEKSDLDFVGGSQVGNFPY